MSYGYSGTYDPRTSHPQPAYAPAAPIPLAAGSSRDHYSQSFQPQYVYEPTADYLANLRVKHEEQLSRDITYPPHLEWEAYNIEHRHHPDPKSNLSNFIEASDRRFGEPASCAPSAYGVAWIDYETPYQVYGVSVFKPLWRPSASQKYRKRIVGERIRKSRELMGLERLPNSAYGKPNWDQKSHEWSFVNCVEHSTLPTIINEAQRYREPNDLLIINIEVRTRAHHVEERGQAAFDPRPLCRNCVVFVNHLTQKDESLVILDHAVGRKPRVYASDRAKKIYSQIKNKLND
ncbi:hypothetical protein M422DRAFT_782519 [Sphaerobolus stellatus SS14]|uniref:Uncharacterized protein n=1 Tax=Sphaerobolus stellatus (strain SS14) TaxID=990650 RepID=A0A0C9V1G7_SPHS4|nr:hypothetical protein M422DRAFT_782519 [Sphaerobolus stellatus SS14]